MAAAHLIDGGCDCGGVRYRLTAPADSLARFEALGSRIAAQCAERGV